jgi:ribosome maturation factor RimP
VIDEQLHTEGGLAMADLAASRARLVQLLTPAVQGTGHDLEDVSVSPAGRRKVVRVVVDKDGGITLDDVAEVSRVVSDVLDTPECEHLLAGAYTLEVSSPGVDRPLTEQRHWRRNVGRLVRAKLADGSTVTGRVRDAGDAEVVLDVDGAARTLLRAEVASAYVQVEFSRTAEEDA